MKGQAHAPTRPPAHLLLIPIVLCKVSVSFELWVVHDLRHNVVLLVFILLHMTARWLRPLLLLGRRPWPAPPSLSRRRGCWCCCPWAAWPATRPTCRWRWRGHAESMAGRWAAWRRLLVLLLHAAPVASAWHWVVAG